MIEARRLHILRAVADHGTVTAAAAALYLTPSAVSQQLSALEQETGHRLVERGARGVRLTPPGEILLAHTHAVLAELERAEAELAAYRTGASGTVTVTSFATGINLVVAPALAVLAGTAPGIRVRVRDAEGDASLRMVLDRRTDVAVAVEYRGAPGADDPRLTRVPLYAEPFDAVLPPGHPLTAAERVPLADLAADPWIGPFPGTPATTSSSSPANTRASSPPSNTSPTTSARSSPSRRRAPESHSSRARHCGAWTWTARWSARWTARPRPAGSSRRCGAVRRNTH